MVTLGYWNCRGYVEAIRLILEYTGTSYTFKTHQCGPAPHYDKVDWMAKKASLLADFDFPNLPYYNDGSGIRLTHNMAIVQHLARKNGLVPASDSEIEWVDLDLFREQLLELRDAVVEYVYFPKHRAKGVEPTEEEKLNKKAAFVNSFEKHAELLSKKMSSTGGPWLIGSRLTYVDFLCYEFVDQARCVITRTEADAALKGKTPLVNFITRFESLARVGDYIANRRKYPVYTERTYVGRTEPTQ